MSKLLRSELKSIVKECLVEILSEGLAGNNNGFIQESKQSSKSLSRDSKNVDVNSKSSYLNKVSYSQKSSSKNQKPVNRIKNTNLTSDPILNDLLADTAKTTLQEQLSAESRRGSVITPGADSITKMVNDSNPQDLFGHESAGKWAKLAFFDQ